MSTLFQGQLICSNLHDHKQISFNNSENKFMWPNFCLMNEDIFQFESFWFITLLSRYHIYLLWVGSAFQMFGSDILLFSFFAVNGYMCYLWHNISFHQMIVDRSLRDPKLSISLCWLAVMLFNQMSNSTGLWYTSQPLNHCFQWTESACTQQTNVLQHTQKKASAHTQEAFTGRPALLNQ